MKTPEELQKKLLKNPWFLWVLILLGVNPLYLVGPALSTTAKQLENVAETTALASFRSSRNN